MSTLRPELRGAERRSGEVAGGEAAAAEELRRLVTLLERSGMAERRADVRALLDASRQMLQAPPPRPEPSARMVAGKLATLALLALDATAMVALLRSLWLAVTAPDQMGAIEIGLVPLVLVYGVFRLGGGLDWLEEAWHRLTFHLAYGRDWFGEAFSRAAMHRLTAKMVAQEAMWGWRQQRNTLPHRATLQDVEGYLYQAYCARAARSFRAGAEALGESAGVPMRDIRRRRRMARRLEALRWSALMTSFEELAQSGTLWPEPPPPPPPPPAERPTLPPPQLVEAETPERAQRRRDIRELIERKRKDITGAYAWKLKTSAEIEQRDTYLAQIRSEITALEKEMRELGG